MALTKMNFKILVISPDGVTEKFIEAYQFTVGRSDHADLIVPFNGVSRLHLSFFAKDADIFVRDLNSAFGTKLNGKALSKNKIYRYPQGASLRLGKAPVIISVRMLTNIETRQLEAKENKTYIHRYIKPDAIQDINAFLSSLIRPNSVLNAVAKRSLMTWEEGFQGQMQKLVDELKKLKQDTLKQARHQAEQIIAEANTVALQIQSQARADSQDYLDEVNRKGMELIHKSTDAADEIKSVAISEKENIVRTAEAKAHTLLKQAEEQFNEITEKADSLRESYKSKAEADAKEIVIRAETQAEVLERESKISADELLAKATNEAELIKSKIDGERNELLTKAKAQAESIIQSAENQANIEINRGKNVAVAEIKKAKEEASFCLEKAKTESDELINKIKEQATKLRQEAESSARDILNKAEEQAHAHIQEAKNKHSQIMRAASDEANKVKSEGEEEKKRLIELAELSGERIKKEYADQGAAIIRESHDEAEIYINDAKEKAHLIETEAKEQSEKILQAVKAQCQELEKKSNDLLATQQNQAEALTAEAKVENERLEKANRELEELIKTNQEAFDFGKKKFEEKIVSLKEKISHLEIESRATAKEILDKANIAAQVIVEEAEHKSLAQIQKANESAKASREQAESEAASLRAEVQKSIEKQLKEAKEQAQQLTREAKEFFSESKLKAQNEATLIIDKAHAERTAIESKYKNTLDELARQNILKADSTKELHVIEQELEKAKARLEVIEDEYKLQFQKKQEQNQSFKEDLKKHESLIIDLNSKMNDARKEFADQQSQHQSTLQKQQNEIQNRESQITNLNKTLELTKLELQETEKNIQLMQKENSELITELKKREQDILGSAQSEARKIILAAEQQAEATKTQSEHKAREYANKLEREHSQQIKSLEQEMMARRVQGNEELKATLHEKQKDFEQQRKIETREIMHELQQGVLPLIEQISSIGEENQKLIFNQIKKIVKSVLSGESVEHSNKVKSLMAFNPEHALKSRQYWYRKSAWAGVASVVIIAFIISPQFFAKVGYKVLALVTPEAQLQEIMAKEHFERLRKLRQYSPETTDDFKNSFTDNLLYTTGYAETITDSKYKEQWTLELNKFFLNQLDLHETTIAKYMGMESKTLLTLEKFREGINASTPETLKLGIEKMREEEKEKVNEMVGLLGGKKNYNKFWEFHGQYFTNHKLQMRNLASEKESHKSQTPNDNKAGPGEDPEVYSIEE